MPYIPQSKDMWFYGTQNKKYKETYKTNRTMSKAEKFIQNYTRNCSNECWDAEGNYIPWLSVDEARKAVEIAREETLQEVKSKLLYMLNTSIDNKQFFEQLDDYIEELKTMKDEVS